MDVPESNKTIPAMPPHSDVLSNVWASVSDEFDRYLHRKNVSPNDRGDLLSDCYLRLAAHTSLLEQAREPTRYAWAIMRNLLKDWLRRKARYRDLSLNELQDDGWQWVETDDDPCDQTFRTMEHDARSRIHKTTHDLGRHMVECGVLAPDDWAMFTSYIESRALPPSERAAQVDQSINMADAGNRRRFYRTTKLLHESMIELSECDVELRADLVLLEIINP